MSDTVLSNFTQTVEEERKFDRIYKVAIIGTGWIAEAHIESYLAQPDVEVVALADMIPGKAAAFAKHYGIENNPDILILSSPILQANLSSIFRNLPLMNTGLRSSIL